MTMLPSIEHASVHSSSHTVPRLALPHWETRRVDGWVLMDWFIVWLALSSSSPCENRRGGCLTQAACVILVRIGSVFVRPAILMPSEVGLYGLGEVGTVN